jgi:phage gp36-like protein
VAVYTTRERVRIALARDLDDVDGTAASLKDEAIEDAIVEATSRVDGKLGGRYKVPFADPVPALVQTICRDLSMFLCDLTFREVRDYASQFNPVYIRYQEAIKTLDQIAAGQISLPDAPGVETPLGSGEAVIVINQTDQLFSPCDFDLRRRYRVWP